MGPARGGDEGAKLGVVETPIRSHTTADVHTEGTHGADGVRNVLGAEPAGEEEGNPERRASSTEPGP